jgi:hypothetical protein
MQVLFITTLKRFMGDYRYAGCQVKCAGMPFVWVYCFHKA